MPPEFIPSQPLHAGKMRNLPDKPKTVRHNGTAFSYENTF
jgi:hypothetical protein